MERALGDPALVLCSACLKRNEHEQRWLPLRCNADQALLVRDVCVHPHCPHLQVCGHLCVTHVLERELGWQDQSHSVRACSGCRESALEIYRKNRDVWFILEEGEHATQALGVERRVKKPMSNSLEVTGVRTRAADRRTKCSQDQRPLRRGKLRRSVKKHKMQKEQRLVNERSSDNALLNETSKCLWRDKQKRSETETESTLTASCTASLAAESGKDDCMLDGNTRPVPEEVFCMIAGCTRYAKTGKWCRFHALEPLVFIRPSVCAKTAGSTAVLAK
uniref:Uncharacterized protein n=1 Tax=Peronospora matthiolae TaxID=2874970 RepID=A0AAV1TXZ5_9STRA